MIDLKNVTIRLKTSKKANTPNNKYLNHCKKSSQNITPPTVFHDEEGIKIANASSSNKISNEPRSLVAHQIQLKTRIVELEIQEIALNDKIEKQAKYISELEKNLQLLQEKLYRKKEACMEANVLIKKLKKEIKESKK